MVVSMIKFGFPWYYEGQITMAEDYNSGILVDKTRPELK